MSLKLSDSRGQRKHFPDGFALFSIRLSLLAHIFWRTRTSSPPSSPFVCSFIQFACITRRFYWNWRKLKITLTMKPRLRRFYVKQYISTYWSKSKIFIFNKIFNFFKFWSIIDFVVNLQLIYRYSRNFQWHFISSIAWGRHLYVNEHFSNRNGMMNDSLFQQQFLNAHFFIDRRSEIWMFTLSRFSMCSPIVQQIYTCSVLPALLWLIIVWSFPMRCSNRDGSKCQTVCRSTLSSW